MRSTEHHDGFEVWRSQARILYVEIETAQHENVPFDESGRSYDGPNGSGCNDRG